MTARPKLFSIDFLLIVLFAVLGRLAHDRGLSSTGVFETAWPFAIGLIGGWALVLALGRAPERILPGGIVIWLVTIGVGLPLWGTVYGERTIPHISFVLVAGTTTFILLNGYRAIVRRNDRRG